MQEGLKIFVIIVTYNGKQWYDRCFTSLRHSTIPVQTIVVDNASNDGTVEYIKEHFPEIILIESQENLGFGKANNLAMRYALDHDCDYVFLLNQDTWLSELDAIEKLVTIAEQHPEYGILSPLHVRADGKTLGMMLEYRNNTTSMAILSDMLQGDIKAIYSTNYINAAAWLLSRNTLEVVGGFDPIFQHYEEDDDYLNRVHFHGMKIGVCPSIRLVHDHIDIANPFDEKNARYRHEQSLLVELMDINKQSAIGLQIRYLIRKMLLLFLLGKWSMLRTMWLDLFYIFRMRKAIKQNRLQNSQKEASWL